MLAALKGLAWLVVLGVLVWVVLFLLKMVVLLIPLALLATGGYLAYKYLRHRLLT